MTAPARIGWAVADGRRSLPMPSWPRPSRDRAMVPQDMSDAPDRDRDLVLNRFVDASPAALYRCWTEPELLRRWFAPEPWTVPVAELDLRVGGASLVVMRAPDGTDYPNRGVYLELVPGERIVFTDAFVDSWTPSPKPFMTVVLTFRAPRDRMDALRHPRPTLDRCRSRGSRSHGLPPGLGPLRRPDGEPRPEPMSPAPLRRRRRPAASGHRAPPRARRG